MTFKLVKISKSTYIMANESGAALSSPTIHGSLGLAMEWAKAWASSWPNTEVVYEES